MPCDSRRPVALTLKVVDVNTQLSIVQRQSVRLMCLTADADVDADAYAVHLPPPLTAEVATGNRKRRPAKKQVLLCE